MINLILKFVFNNILVAKICFCVFVKLASLYFVFGNSSIFCSHKIIIYVINVRLKYVCVSL